jgi:hypothetical protein
LFAPHGIESRREGVKVTKSRKRASEKFRIGIETRLSEMNNRRIGKAWRTFGFDRLFFIAHVASTLAKA